MHSFSYYGQSVANWEHAFTVGSRSQTVETEILNPTRFLPPASSLLHGTAPASKRLGSVDSVILNVQDMSCMIIIMNYRTATVTGRANARRRRPWQRLPSPAHTYQCARVGSERCTPADHWMPSPASRVIPGASSLATIRALVTAW